MVQLGSIDISAQPECIARFGAIERWRGRHGPGNLAAHAAMDRALELARTNGIGAVALGESTHWMRAGTFGWQAAEAGLAAICWSNTLPNLPPWGAKTPALGNNPLVIAVPRGNAPLVLDMAISQFSYGSLESYRLRGLPLPVPGGFDAAGQLTTDPAAIEATQRALPIGFWKGSGLAIVLDVLGAMLSGGKATCQFDPDALKEVGQSQVFIAMSPSNLGAVEEMEALAAAAIAALHAAEPIVPGTPARYPGEQTLQVRAESLRLGVAIDEAAWNRFLALEAAP
jgi:3-dehydro-L-gulonate 2-dehydrogenase